MVENATEVPLLKSSLENQVTTRWPTVTLQDEVQDKSKDPQELVEIHNFIDGQIAVRSTQSQQPSNNFARRPAKTANFSKILPTPDEKLILVCEGTFTLKETRAQRSNNSIKVSQNEITAVLLIPLTATTGEIILGDTTGHLFRYSYPSLKPLDSLLLHKTRIFRIKYSEKHGFLYTAAESLIKIQLSNSSREVLIDSPVKDFDIYEENLVYCGEFVELICNSSIKLAQEQFEAVCISQFYVAAGNNAKIKVWTVAGQEFRVFFHNASVNSMKFSRAGNEFSAFSQDGSVKIWHLEQNYREKVFKKLSGIKDAYLNEDFSVLYFITKDLADKHLVESWTDEEIVRISTRPENFVSNNERFAWSNCKTVNFYNYTTKETQTLTTESDVSKIVLSSDCFYVLTNKTSIQKHDYENLSQVELLANVTDSTILDFEISPKSEFLVYTSENSQIYVFNLVQNQIIRTIDKKFRNRASLLSNLQLFNTYFYVCTETVCSKIPYHDSGVDEMCFTDWQGKIQKAKVSNDESIILKSPILTALPPNSPSGNSNLNIIKVFCAVKHKVLKEIAVHKSRIVNFEFSLDNLYFLVASEDGHISVWSKETLSMISIINYEKPIIHFGFTLDTKKLVIAHENEVLITDNPVATDKVQIFGPDRGLTYDIIYFFKEIKENNSKSLNSPTQNSYSSQIDQYIFSPSLMNAMHLYSSRRSCDDFYFQSLSSSAPFYNSKQGLNPLSFLLQRDEQSHVLKTLEKKINESISDPLVLQFLNTQTLVLLNTRGYAGIEALYEAIYQPFTNTSLPKYVETDNFLPLVLYSDVLEPVANRFLSADQYTQLGIPIVFFGSLVKVNMSSGSQESLDFLKSLSECANQEIFSKPFVKILLTEKWKLVKWMMVVQALVYLGFVVCLIGFVVGEELGFGGVFLYLGQGVNVLLVGYEVYQVVLLGSEYFRDFWNYVDIVRFLSYSALTVVVGFCSKIDFSSDYFLFLEVLVIISTWVRGLTYFRIFDSVRYLTTLIFEVISDMLSFTVLALYSVIGLSLMLFACSSTESNSHYLSFLGFTYMTTIGEYGSFGQDIQTFKSLGITIFTVTSIINTIVMMNLLISIMGDTFDRVQQRSNVTDFKELISMIYEMETLLFYKKGVKEGVYIQKLGVRFGSGEDGEAWEGKVKEMMKSVEAVKEEVRAAVGIMKGFREEDVRENEERKKELREIRELVGVLAERVK